MFLPTRAAPSPPTGLPSSHPFATYYVPPNTPIPSISTVLSGSGGSSVPPSPSTSSRSTESTQSRSTDSRDSRSPPAQTQSLRYPPRDSICQPNYTTLPSELAIFDHRPRQNLLSDIEYITGKKLHFRLLSRLSSKLAGKKSESSNREEKRSSGGSIRSGSELRKEREHSWEEDFAWDGVALVDDRSEKRGEA